MRIAFIGTVDFSYHCLQEVIDAGGEVVGVITLSKERAAFNSDFADLTELARDNNIPVSQVENINSSESYDTIKSYSPDVIFVFGWSQLISKPILDITPLGCIGTHPALLPRNRGRHPLIWALVEGLEQSGLTFFYLDEGADSGDILWQKPFDISLVDNAASVYEKIKILASEGIRDFLPKLASGTVQRQPQDHSLATYWRKRGEKDGEIDWSAGTTTTYNLIRALTHPYVGAHTYCGNQIVKVWQASLPDADLPEQVHAMASGTVFDVGDDCLKVRTSDGYLTIFTYETADGSVIEAETILGETV